MAAKVPLILLLCLFGLSCARWIYVPERLDVESDFPSFQRDYPAFKREPSCEVGKTCMSKSACPGCSYCDMHGGGATMKCVA